MSCAACSARVEKAVKSVPGVTSAAVNLLTNSMTVTGSASDEAIIKAVNDAGYGCSLKQDDYSLEDRTTPKLLLRLIISAVVSAVLMYFCMARPGELRLLQAALALAVMAINYRYFVSGVKGVIHKAPNMDTLVAMGSLASFIYGYYDSAAMILALIDVGKTLESYSKGKTTNAIRSLMKLVPQVDIKVGEEFELRPGESIPADAEIIEGVSAVDESALTGESIPVDKTVGDTVSAGTINKSGYLKCRAVKVGNDTALGQIIKMVSDASGTKAPIAKIADKAAGVFVPVVIGIAAVTFVIWMIAGSGAGFALSRAVSVLVISCPCAMGLATPVAIMVGNGKGAKNGILFKTAVSLEQAGKVNIAALDKTGTITKGEPVVTDVIPIASGTCGNCPDCTGAGSCDNYGTASEEKLLDIAYALEIKSEHPLAKAIVKYVGSGKEAEDFKALTGSGVEGKLDGKVIIGGSRRFIEHDKGIEIGHKAELSCDTLAEQGKTPLIFAEDGRPVGIIAVADAIKEDSAEAIKQLKNQGVRVVMITGDNESTARAIGEQAGVDEVIAGVMPDEKAGVIARMQESGDSVMMVGDGINDAPALTRAGIGAAIGAGTDVAIDAADVVLMKSGLTDVAAAIRLSRAVIKNIKENLFWAFCYNIIGIPLAAGVWIPITGWTLNPMFCAGAMSFSSFFVVMNALRLNFVDVYDGSKDRKTENKRKTEKREFAGRREERKMFTTTVEVTGMMCPMCEKHTNEAIEKAFDVESVTSDHSANRTVIVSAEKLDEAKLAETIKAAGYTPGAITVE